MFHHALAAGAALTPVRTVLVAGHGADAVTKAARDMDPSIRVTIQEDQRGTAHAAAQAGPELTGFDGDAVRLSSAAIRSERCGTPAPPARTW